MGFYLVVPRVLVYELGSQAFDSHDNKYFNRIRRNGSAQNQIWFRRAEVLNGATIQLDMSSTLNTTLSADISEFPLSSLTLDPAVFAK